MKRVSFGIDDAGLEDLSDIRGAGFEDLPDFDDLKNILLECDLKELPDDFPMIPDDFPCLPDVKQC